jgi:hypothetical protein
MRARLTLTDGPTVELAVTDDRLAVIASRRVPVEAGPDGWDAALLDMGLVRMSDWRLSSSGYGCRVARL